MPPALPNTSAHLSTKILNHKTGSTDHSKARVKVESGGMKKRPAVTETCDFTSPAKKPRSSEQANRGKKVDSGHTAELCQVPSLEVIEISSDEEDCYTPKIRGRTQGVERNPEMLRALGTYPFPVKQEKSFSKGPGSSWSCESSTDATRSDGEKSASTFSTARHEVVQTRDEHQDVVNKDRLEQVQSELETQRQRNVLITADWEKMQQKLQDTQDCSEKYTQLLVQQQELQERRESAKKAYEKEKEGNAKVLKDVLSESEKQRVQNNELSERLRSLQVKNDQLQQEVNSLKTAYPGRTVHPLPSPAPSSQSSASMDEERKEANVRSVYVKTKKQYDTLHAAAGNLVACTRSMDLSSFGEFGIYMKKLRDCLN